MKQQGFALDMSISEEVLGVAYFLKGGERKRKEKNWVPVYQQRSRCCKFKDLFVVAMICGRCSELCTRVGKGTEEEEKGEKRREEEAYDNIWRFPNRLSDVVVWRLHCRCNNNKGSNNKHSICPQEVYLWIGGGSGEGGRREHVVSSIMISLSSPGDAGQLPGDWLVG